MDNDRIATMLLDSSAMNMFPVARCSLLLGLAGHHEKFAKRPVLSRFLECLLVRPLLSEGPFGVGPFDPALSYASLE